MKVAQQTIFTIIAIIVACCIFMYAAQIYVLNRRPHVKDIWVINLDKDTERMAAITARTQHIQDIVHRWPATNGKALTREEIHKEGVGYAMTRTGEQEKDKAGEMRNRGVVGCWLSHKRLLEHLATLDVPEYYGHLIVEDDVEFPSDFLKPGDEWHAVYKTIPTDWDIVYFGLTEPLGKPIAPRVLRARTAHGDGNWGTHAYMVRHSSIKTKILPWLSHMVDAIDEQYNLKLGDWNVYVVQPAIITLNEEMSKNSSLLKVNVGATDNTQMTY